LPLYEYRCSEGHISEMLRKMTERDDPLICHCGLEAERKISVCNNSFGWTPSDDSYTDKSKPITLVRNV